MKEETRKEWQSKMAGFKKSAPPVSWDYIEKSLASKSPSSKAIPLWLKVSGVAAILLLVLGVGLRFFNPESESTNRQLANNEKHMHAIESETQEENNPIEERIGSSVIKKILNVYDSELIAENTSAPVTKIELDDVKEDNAGVVDNSQSEQQAEAQDKEKHVATKKGNDYTEEPMKHNFNRSSVSSGRLTAKAYMSNMGGGASTTTSMNTMMTSANPYGIYNDEMNVKDRMYLNEGKPEIEEEINHRQPIRFGVSIRYNINSRWSVESGLTYTLLVSDLTRKISGYTYTTEQRLSYVGLPVGVSYSIWQNRHFNIYASVGGIIEKMVNGKQTTQITNQPSAGLSETTGVSIHPLQLSLNGGMGAEYNINKSISVYAEPGMAYHFDNGSDISTLYKDKPLGFNLNLGLRFNFK